MNAFFMFDVDVGCVSTGLISFDPKRFIPTLEMAQFGVKTQIKGWLGVGLLNFIIDCDSPIQSDKVNQTAEFGGVVSASLQAFGVQLNITHFLLCNASFIRWQCLLSGIRNKSKQSRISVSDANRLLDNLPHSLDITCNTIFFLISSLLDGDYMIPVGRDKILSRFAEFPVVL